MSQVQHLKILHETAINPTTNDNTIKGKIQYEQGTEGAKIMFVLKCTKLPIGTEVSFWCDKAGPNPPIKVSPTKTSSYPYFSIGTESEIPANFSADIYYEAVLPQGQKPEDGMKIELCAAYAVNSQH